VVVVQEERQDHVQQQGKGPEEEHEGLGATRVDGPQVLQGVRYGAVTVVGERGHHPEVHGGQQVEHHAGRQAARAARPPWWLLLLGTGLEASRRLCGQFIAITVVVQFEHPKGVDAGA